jgi:molecular chaperone GrpE
MPRKKGEEQEAAETTAAAETDAAEPAGTDMSEELERLRKELAEAQERADRYHSNWQRSAADFQNWKRRADQEKSDAGRAAEAGLTAELLSVLDDLERAFQSLPNELRTLTWVEGVAMVWQKMFSILQMRGLSPIDALGKEFDPRLHEAVLHEDDSDLSEQTSVVAELQRGYRYHDRVLRATLVKVGKPKQTTDDQHIGHEGETVDSPKEPAAPAAEGQ